MITFYICSKVLFLKLNGSEDDLLLKNVLDDLKSDLNDKAYTDVKNVHKYFG